MAYTLDTFCNDARSSLTSRSLQAALEEIASNLRNLLGNPDFVKSTFDDETPVGKQTLYHDSQTGFYVMAHVQGAGKTGRPHSHGASWAIYGNAKGSTEMTEWRRVNSENELAHVLEPTEKYSLVPGQSRGYGPGVIHSTAHPEKAWVIRITGADLDRLPRYHFDRKRDRIVEQT